MCPFADVSQTAQSMDVKCWSKDWKEYSIDVQTLIFMYHTYIQNGIMRSPNVEILTSRNVFYNFQHDNYHETLRMVRSLVPSYFEIFRTG